MKPQESRFQIVDVPPSLGDVIHVLRVIDATRVTAQVLSTKIRGTFTHWDEDVKRTVACPKKPIKCELCERKVPKRYAGMVHVVLADRVTEAIVELTNLAALRLLSLQEHNDNVLRGICVVIYRERGNKKSPLAVERVHPLMAVENLPKERSVEPTMDRVWPKRPVGNKRKK